MIEFWAKIGGIRTTIPTFYDDQYSDYNGFGHADPKNTTQSVV